MYNENSVRRPLKDLTVSATLKKRMDFSEVTGDPRGASLLDLCRRLSRVGGRFLCQLTHQLAAVKRNANHSSSVTPQNAFIYFFQNAL